MYPFGVRFIIILRANKGARFSFTFTRFTSTVSIRAPSWGATQICDAGILQRIVSIRASVEDATYPRIFSLDHVCVSIRASIKDATLVSIGD